MEIGKYKQAMKYLLNDNAPLKTFVINPDARLTDNDPKPIEGFAEGGVVGGEPVKAGELLSYLKKYGVNIHPGNLSRSSQMYGIKSPSSGRYILPSKDKIKTIKEEWYKNQQRAPATTEIGRKSFQERNNLVKELVSSGKYNPTEIKEIIQNKYNVDMGNTIWKEIIQQRKEGKIIPSAREGETSTNAKKMLKDIYSLDENKKIRNILSDPDFDIKKDYSKIFKEAKNTLNLDDSKTNYRLASLLKSYSEEKIPSNKNIINNSNEIYSSYLKDRPFGSLGSVLYRKQQVEPGVASQIGEDPTYFSNLRKKISRLLPKENVYSTDELKNLISSYENKTGPYSLFVQGIKKDINLSKGRTIDKVINQAEKEMQKLDINDPDYLDKRNEIKDKYNQRVKEFTGKYNENLKKGQLPVRGLELSFDSPKESLARYNELKKINPNLIKGVEDIYNKYGYSFKIPADIKTAPEALDFVKSAAGQNLMKKASDVDASRIYAEVIPGLGGTVEDLSKGKIGKGLLKAAGMAGTALTAKDFAEAYDEGRPVLDATVYGALGLPGPIEEYTRSKNLSEIDKLSKKRLDILDALKEGLIKKRDIETIADQDPDFKGDPKNYLNFLYTKAPESKKIVDEAEERFQEKIWQPFLEEKKSKRMTISDIPIFQKIKENYQQLLQNEEQPTENTYEFSKGGRVGFSGGGGAIKLARLISESLLDLKNNITMVSNTARFSGTQKAKLEALTPYRNIPNESKHTSILKSIEKAKENLPKEYHSILDDIKKDVDNFDYTTADVRIKALDKEVSPEIRFEGLSQDLFPMEDPLNNSFIIMDPNRDRMTGRFVHRVGVDPETGRGIRQTFDTFDSQSKKFLDEKDWKLMGVESLEKGKEGLN